MAHVIEEVYTTRNIQKGACPWKIIIIIIFIFCIWQFAQCMLFESN